MRSIEVLLLAGAGAVAVLQSPTGRTRAARLIVHGGRSAGPAAARAGRATSRAVRAARGRYDTVLTRVAPPRPIPCLVPGCTWEQDQPSSAALLDHMRTAHTPTPTPAPAAPAGPVSAPGRPEPRRLRTVDDRPAERITQLAPGVYVGHQLNAVIDKIGSHMDQFRAVSRALNAAGEIEPAGLLALLEAMVGMQTALAGVANMITDITEYADTEMWVDLRAIGPLYEAAGSVLSEVTTVRRAMETLRHMYRAEIEVEQKAADGTVRTLNPRITSAA